MWTSVHLGRSIMAPDKILMVFLIPKLSINNKGMMLVFFEDRISLLTDSLMADERRNGRLNGEGTGY